ncbi:SasC/FmtB family protein, partial [Staphylococcus epidermidis]|uniref:SasC/FmtB family protein n=1 Tax=Staphylococcus epidermidis TaxID=1282 RepID=UPI0011AA1406
TLKLQFLPINQIHSHFKTIQHLHDPYTYYSFIHTIPLNSPSHLYLKSTQLNKNLNNPKQFQVNTPIHNNPNFPAPIRQNQLTYKLTLPQNFQYLHNSTQVSFVNANLPNSTLNPFSLNF